MFHSSLYLVILRLYLVIASCVVNHGAPLTLGFPAIRARRFMRSLLNSDGVREAIAEAGGWVDVEKLASDLKRCVS